MRLKAYSLGMLFVFMTLSQTLVSNVHASSEIDNWPENDAMLNIELNSWMANETAEWDNNGGLPDPKFKICVEADSVLIDCMNTPTWDNQYVLTNVWNYSIDIPDESNRLNITIECRDNDALNDDECDMNSDIAEWKLFYEYNWSSNPVVEYSSSGNGDETNNWKDAASTWSFNIFGYGDRDNDGINDLLDQCDDTIYTQLMANQTNFPGCSWYQLDLDRDGIISHKDSNPFDARIREVIGGNRNISTNFETVGTCIAPNYVNLQIMNNSDLSLGCEFERWQVPLQDNNAMDLLMHSTNYDSNFIDFDLDGIVDLSLPLYNWVSVDSRNIDIFSSVCQTNDNSLPANILIKQDQDSNKVLVSCISAVSHDTECQFSVYLMENISSFTEVLSFYYGYEEIQSMGGNRCHSSTSNGVNGQANKQLSHYGDFGDFDGNGIIDFVHNKNVNCEIFFGLDSEQILFSEPQSIGLCEGGLSVADIDNDGFDDIISRSGVHFMSDDGLLESSPRFNLASGICSDAFVISHVFDYDVDGDLDVIFKTSGNRPSLYNWDYLDEEFFCTIIFENNWFADEDNDGVEDSLDICPGFDDSVDTDNDDIPDGCDTDDDGDGTVDEDDLCPNTPLGATVDLGCPMDSDEDGVYDGLDLCPESVGHAVDDTGCSNYQKDSDGDGVVDALDGCEEVYSELDNEVGVVFTEETLSPNLLPEHIGCTPDQYLALVDPDGDGKFNYIIPHLEGSLGYSIDMCPDTPAGETVGVDGCSYSQTDWDGDGIMDKDDNDDDNDGVLEPNDWCPRTPANVTVDSNGCSQAQGEVQYDTDDASSSTDSSAGVVCFFAILVIVGVILIISKGSKKEEVRRVRTPTSGDRFSPVPGKMPVRQPNQQEMMQKLENERRYAQQQVMQLQQQLNQSNQMSASQLSSLQSQMQQMQDSVAASEQAKAQIEAELEEIKTQTSKTTMDGPMAAEAISQQGDAVTGTKIVNDADAIAKAAGAIAIEAYKRGQKDATSPRCPKCNSVVEAHWKFCVECTEPLN